MNDSYTHRYIFQSQHGAQEIAQIFDKLNPMKGVNWTCDVHAELPIFLNKDGDGSETPYTLIDGFKQTLQTKGHLPALNYKKEGKWRTINYFQYYKQCQTFAKALLRFKIGQKKAVNIIGFNSVEWVVGFLGSVLSNCLPVGIYTTNRSQTCKYIAQHSQCQLVLAQNNIQLSKYLQIWDDLPNLKLIVIWKQKVRQNIPSKYKGKVLTWSEFMQQGQKATNQNQLEKKISKQKPGHCCTLIYTSGTTGTPKAVMLSHDNFTWLKGIIIKMYKNKQQLNKQQKIISYLPLSHVAALLIDVCGSMLQGVNLFFVDETALQGSLVNFLKQIQPTFFFSVPRVWEKLQEQLRIIGSKKSGIIKKISNWTKSMGQAGTFAQLNNSRTPFMWSIAKKLVFNNIKKALGINQSKYLIYGAAPLNPSIRQYFMQLNIYLINAYGMSQCTGPQTFTDFAKFKSINKEFYYQSGFKIIGTQLKIKNPDAQGNGEICFRGRNRFMGYFKNEEQTMNLIDKDGFLMSGDQGRLDKNGNLFITGRIKQLIITAGGQNIAPLPIQTQIKKHLPFISNVMVVGDNRKFLSCLITLKLSNQKILPQSIHYLKQFGSQAKTIQQAKVCPKVLMQIQSGINKANQMAISRAHRIQKFAILSEDFSIQNGVLTSTFKPKRKVAVQRYSKQINLMYQQPKL